jgi:hypothetical protein
MKTIFTVVLLLAISTHSFSQVTVNGSSSATSAPNNGPAIVVDNALTVSTSSSLPRFTVSVASNFSSGDVLSYTGALPSGVSASYASGTGVLTFTGSATAANYQALLRTVTFSTTSSSTASRTITFSASDPSLSYNSSNGHYYQYVSGSFSWTAAKADAAAKNFFGAQGYLATITNSTENTFVNNLSGKGWLGASDSYSEINAATGTTTYASQANSEGKWYWVTGPEKGTLFSNGSSVVTYANWASGEPNNSGSLEHYAENSWASGYWNDGQVGGPIGYILEYGGSAGDPSLDLTHSRSITMVATQLKTVTASTNYKLHDASVYVDPALTLYSAGNITDAKVTISGNFNPGDALSYTGSLPTGVAVSGTGYNATTGVLSFSGTTTPSSWQTLLRTVRFNSSSNIIGDRDITFSVGNQVAFTNGHFYESVTSTANWSTAKTNAAAKTYLGLQGYLATITSSAENDFVKQKIGTDAWIGLTDQYTEINAATGVTTYASQSAAEGKWYWVTGPEKGTQITTTNASGSGTGTPFGSAFNNWNPGEPNNLGPENYAEIYASGTNSGKWNDLSGGGSLMYVVEYGGLSTDPVVTLSANSKIINSSVLPVTGLEFNVQQSAKGIDLVWSTLMEINCERFDVLHSTDGNNFTKIGTVKGHGSIDIKQQYSFIDNAPSYGNNYYRLQQFDIDGNFKFSPVKQIGFGISKTQVYPNPVQATLTVIHSSVGKLTNLSIYSISGRLMLQQKLIVEKTLVDVHTFVPGMYIAEIREENGKSTQLMFTRQ